MRQVRANVVRTFEAMFAHEAAGAFVAEGDVRRAPQHACEQASRPRRYDGARADADKGHPRAGETSQPRPLPGAERIAPEAAEEIEQRIRAGYDQQIDAAQTAIRLPGKSQLGRHGAPPRHNDADRSDHDPEQRDAASVPAPSGDGTRRRRAWKTRDVCAGR